MSAGLSEGFNSALNYVIESTLIIATRFPRTLSYLRPVISNYGLQHANCNYCVSFIDKFSNTTAVE
jgi:hypothetical protein